MSGKPVRISASLLNKVYRQETRVVVEKSGIPVAAIVSVDDLERLKALEAERSNDFAAIRRVGEAFKDVEPAELERAVAEALAAVREERRRERRL